MLYVNNHSLIVRTSENSFKSKTEKSKPSESVALRNSVSHFTINDLIDITNQKGYRYSQKSEPPTKAKTLEKLQSLLTVQKYPRFREEFQLMQNKIESRKNSVEFESNSNKVKLRTTASQTDECNTIRKLQSQNRELKYFNNSIMEGLHLQKQKCKEYEKIINRLTEELQKEVKRNNSNLFIPQELFAKKEQECNDLKIALNKYKLVETNIQELEKIYQNCFISINQSLKKTNIFIEKLQKYVNNLCIIQTKLLEHKEIPLQLLVDHRKKVSQDLDESNLLSQSNDNSTAVLEIVERTMQKIQEMTNNAQRQLDKLADSYVAQIVNSQQLSCY